MLNRNMDDSDTDFQPDSAITVVIGGEMANPLGYELAKATKQALDQAVQHIIPGQSMYAYAQQVHTTMTNA
jgi:methionine aminopeptidase